MDYDLYSAPKEPKKIDWYDVFVHLAALGALAYGIYKLMGGI